MSEGAVAERYARAIFEAAEEAGQLSTVAEQVQGFAHAYASSKELAAALGDPSIEDSQRAALVDAVATRLGLVPVAKGAVAVIFRRRRLTQLPAIARQLVALSDEKSGVLRVSLQSAQPLSDSYVRELTREMEQATQRRVVLEQSVNNELIAGVLTKIGDHTIDGTLRGRLEEFGQRLLASTGA